MNRPSLTFDPDGTPRVSIPTDDRGNVASMRVSAEGLAEFIGEVKEHLMRRSGDPELQRKVGKSMLDILGRWVNSK